MAGQNNSPTPDQALHLVYAHGEWEVVLNSSDPEYPIERDDLADGMIYALIFGGDPVATGSTHSLRVVSTWSDGTGDHDHYVVLRLESIVDAEQWATLPWREYRPKQLIVAWNHWHDLISRHDEENGSFAIASWVEVESALARGQHDVHFHDGKERA